MSNSLPSRRITNIDIPVVSTFKAEFIYNFFRTDESTNDKGENIYKKQPSILNLGEYVNKLNKISPRYVKITFSPINSHEIDLNFRFSKFYNLLQDEQKINGQDYTRISFQEDAAEQKLFYVTKKVLDQKIDSANKDIKTKIDLIKNILTSKMSEMSLLDQTKLLNELTPASVSGTFIADSLNNIKRLGAQYIDDNKKRVIENKIFEDIKNINVDIQLNNKFILGAINSSMDDPIGNYGYEIIGVYSHIENINNKALTKNSFKTNIISADEYDASVPYIKEIKLGTNYNEMATKIVGYQIDKYEVQLDGSLIFKDKILVENPTAREIFDFKVVYGKQYVYKIKTIATLEMETITQHGLSVVTVLASSKQSNKIVVSCVETVPPPSPADFNVSWDYTNKAPRITWSFPNNSQQDIKKFQIFRRKTINDPFELIKMYDFDDSEVKLPYLETPDELLVETLDNPRLDYIDYGFNKTSKYIYTLCSIDAHGFSSDYSAQFEISFDITLNKLIKKLISSYGAPKSYPNMYLLQDLFIDTIKTSGASQLRVIFNPEYIKLYDVQKNNLNLIATDKTNGIYKLQLINVDLQKQQILDIGISDLYTTQNS